MAKRTQTNEKPKRGRPVNEARREEIIAAASKLFMTQGFHATTVDQIAAELGISKLTLYSRFKNKDALFSSVIESRANEHIPTSVFQEIRELPLEEALFRLGYSIMRLVSSGTAADIERMLTGATKDKQNLVQLFYEAGPVRIRRLIATYFEELHKAGKIYAPETMLSTQLFTSVFKGSEMCLRSKMNIAPKPTKQEMEYFCRAAVRMFLAAHAPKTKKAK